MGNSPASRTVAIQWRVKGQEISIATEANTRLAESLLNKHVSLEVHLWTLFWIGKLGSFIIFGLVCNTI